MYQLIRQWHYANFPTPIGQGKYTTTEILGEYPNYASALEVMCIEAVQMGFAEDYIENEAPNLELHPVWGDYFYNAYVTLEIKEKE